MGNICLVCCARLLFESGMYVDVGIDWPLMDEPILSAKDRAGKLIEEVEVFA